MFKYVNDKSITDRLIKFIRKLRSKGISIERIRVFINQRYKVSRYEIGCIVDKPYIGTHGGYRGGSGKGCKYILDGVIYDSESEICYKLLNPDAIKCNKPIQLSNNKYVPDFYLNGKYIEIKSNKSDDYWGHNINKLTELIDSNDLIVITQSESINIVNEARNKFGTDYIDSLKRVSSFNTELTWDEF